MWLVFSYIWLPFMILPIYAALERIPDSYIEASRDLGASRLHDASARVILPLALPGVVAGSIFTFSLTLGDYITPTLVGGASSTFIGNVVYNTGLGALGRPAVRGGVRLGATRRHGHLPSAGKTDRRIRGALMERALTQDRLTDLDVARRPLSARRRS